jgi:hypothetical protein
LVNLSKKKNYMQILGKNILENSSLRFTKFRMKIIAKSLFISKNRKFPFIALFNFLADFVDFCRWFRIFRPTDVFVDKNLSILTTLILNKNKSNKIFKNDVFYLEKNLQKISNFQFKKIKRIIRVPIAGYCRTRK